MLLFNPLFKHEYIFPEHGMYQVLESKLLLKIEYQKKSIKQTSQL